MSPSQHARRTRAALLVAVLASAPTLRAQQPAPAALPRPTLTAERGTGVIRLDGVLDEADWARARVATNFTQRFPDPGTPATYQTEVRILYDDDAIYVGARMFDPHPDSIVAPTARHDPQDIYSDWFDVIFDSYHDRRTGFRFGVNPAGTKLDVYHFNDGDDDDAWDARWDVATRIDSGTVWVNQHLAIDANIPFRGSKESGMGAELGQAGLNEYTQAHVVNAVPL